MNPPLSLSFLGENVNLAAASLVDVIDAKDAFRNHFLHQLLDVGLAFFFRHADQQAPLGDDVNLLAVLVDVIEANEAFCDHVLQLLLDRGAAFISLSRHAGHQAHLGDDVNLQTILVDVIEANESSVAISSNSSSIRMLRLFLFLVMVD
jgi:hypothetical protein